jgi:hypothetical protein
VAARLNQEVEKFYGFSLIGRNDLNRWLRPYSFPASPWGSAELRHIAAIEKIFFQCNASAAIPASAPSVATAPPAAVAIFHEIVFPTTKNEYTL